MWLKSFAIAGALLLFGSDALTAANETTEAPLDLLLRCEGIGSRVATETTFIDASNDKGDGAIANATTYKKDRFEERLLLDLKADSARIRLPKSLLPPLNSGGKNGWWQLSELSVSADSISARFRLNPLNRPAIRIDRNTGDIEVAGLGLGFRGSCSRQDRAERKF